jgi:hypothetical protein
MRFRLTYEGELRPTQGEAREQQANPLAAHKHSIRRQFHRQLQQLWATSKFLTECRVAPQLYAAPRSISDDSWYWPADPDEKIPYVDAVASNYHQFGYRFVPLVREQIFLACSLDILFLRRDMPGGAITSAGDIDNRIKTLIDALRRPKYAQELVGNETPGDGEDPFFCLMEDDSQVGRFSVETDVLLDPLIGNDVDQRRAKVVVTVEVKPYYSTPFNLSFAS